MNELQRIKMTRVPFNYRWAEGRRVSVVRELGVFRVGDGTGELPLAMAQAAVDEGYAQSFNPRSRSGGTSKRKSASQARNAADARQPDRVDRKDLAAPDRASGEPPVDDAG